MKHILEHFPKKEMPCMNRANESSNKLIFGEHLSYVKAHAKERGINITKINNGFAVSQWDKHKEPQSINELESFLKKLGIKI